MGAKIPKVFCNESGRFEEYIEAVTSGKGYLPWQKRGVSEEERQFRKQIEARKVRLVERAWDISTPTLFTEADFSQIRKMVDSSPSAEKWYKQVKGTADYLISQPSGYVDRMIPELTPTNGYGWTCPNCVGDKSQEGMGTYRWNFKDPEILTCRSCSQNYPSERFPETARLLCPRRGQTFSFYLNHAQRRHPKDRSGRFAYKWANGWPINISFSGLIRAHKVMFMFSAVMDLALVFRITCDHQYAKLACEILLRLASCYPNWLYHDYRDTFADCDPLFAAWHEKSLPLTFKRHLFTKAFRRDSLKRGSMLQIYRGAGRVWPSTDAIAGLAKIATAYDLVSSWDGGKQKLLWSGPARKKVEKDLILEYLIGSEPFLGGAHKSDNLSNYAPRIYYAMAAVGGTLRLPEFINTALNGYIGILEHAFLPDGACCESPGYTDMYLGNTRKLSKIFNDNRILGPMKEKDLSVTYERLNSINRAILDQLRPNGTYFPLGDTRVDKKPSGAIVKNLVATSESSLDRKPTCGAGLLEGLGVPCIDQSVTIPSEGALNIHWPEIYFPSWMTAILRHHGHDRQGALALTFSPSGLHRHHDNLALFYEQGGDIILGDHGYMVGSPLNQWIKSTFSHNLVIVDEQEQEFAKRKPSLHRMLTSPTISVVEASSQVYGQCSDYRRLIALFKGPGGATFVLDIFRVKGGSTHDYRVFSEIASSDDQRAGMVFSDLDMPDAGPLARGTASSPFLNCQHQNG